MADEGARSVELGAPKALEGQLVLPGGATTSRLTDVLTVPAATALSRGDEPPGAVPDHSPPPEVLDVRVLAEVEAKALAESEGERRYRPKVALDVADKMRTRHHAIARLLAAGRRPSQIAQILDCTPTSIMQLERSPAFQSLVLEYMSLMDKSVADSYLRMKVLGNMAIDEATDRVLNKPEEIENKDLLKLIELASDRTGLGVTTNTNVRVNGAINVADLRAIKAGLIPPPPVKVISQEGDPVEDRGGEDNSDSGVRGQSQADENSEGGDSIREEDRKESPGGGGFISDLDLILR